MTPRLSDDLAAELERTSAAATRSDLAQRWSIAALRTAVERGQVTAMLPGVYAATLHAASTVTRAHAACAWSRHEGVVIGASAAELWGLPVDWRGPLELTAPRGCNAPGAPWLRLRRLVRAIPASTVTFGPVADVRLARIDYAIVTAWNQLGPTRGEDLVYSAIQLRRTDGHALAAVVRDLPRVRHRALLGSIIGAVARGSESHLETFGLRRVFNTAEFACFVRQHWLTVGGRNHRLDMYDPVTRTAVELDGASHGTLERRERDIARDAALASIGILTVRFSYAQLTGSPEQCRQTVRSVLASRSAVTGIQRRATG